MKNTIAVMNTKGGVGKSTVVLALAETLSVYEHKSVLVIDSDAQASVSAMLISTNDLYQIQTSGRTIVEYLVSTVLNNQNEEWGNYVVPAVSDVDDAETVLLLPSDVQLTLFEREVSRESQHTRLRAEIGRLLNNLRDSFDLILIDCPPGLSVLTESWLREADYHITPTKADYISTCGLEVFRRFKSLHPEMGFAQNLGVVINMKDLTSAIDDEYHKWLLQDSDNHCFDSVIPRMNAMQDAARFPRGRPFVCCKVSWRRRPCVVRSCPRNPGIASRSRRGDGTHACIAAQIDRHWPFAADNHHIDFWKFYWSGR